MKNLIFVCLSIILSNVTIAQTKTETKATNDRHTKFAIKAGVNRSTARVYQYDEQLESDVVDGYGIAILFNAPFDGLLHFSPSLGYNRRGYTYTPASGTITNPETSALYAWRTSASVFSCMSTVRRKLHGQMGTRNARNS